MRAGLVEKDEYWRASGALYGQREAPRRWRRTLREWVLKKGMRPSERDDDAYFGKDLVILVFVDDILALGLRTATEWFMRELKERLRCG